MYSSQPDMVDVQMAVNGQTQLQVTSSIGDGLAECAQRTGALCHVMQAAEHSDAESENPNNPTSDV